MKIEPSIASARQVGGSGLKEGGSRFSGGGGEGGRWVISAGLIMFYIEKGKAAHSHIFGAPQQTEGGV